MVVVNVAVVAVAVAVVDVSVVVIVSVVFKVVRVIADVAFKKKYNENKPFS